LLTPEVARLIDGAKYFYVEGYFLTHGLESTLEAAKKASDAGKVSNSHFVFHSLGTCLCPYQVFALNLSAPFIPQFFKVQLEQVLPYCDFVIGNESEAAAWASAVGLANKDIPAIAKSIATLPKLNPSRPRTVVITQGSKPTILVSAADPDKPTTFPVDPLTDEQIVDTNGAGDAFAGGFLGALVAGKSVDSAVLAGHIMGAMCVQLVRMPMTCCFMVFLKRIAGRTAVPMAQGGCVVNTQELNPLSALNSGLWVVVVTSYSTCNYPPALSFPQLGVQNIIPSCRESMVHNGRVFANVWTKNQGWMGNTIGGVGVLSHPLLVGAKQGIPVTAH
jgi:pfkB family carbohydrate kinase